MDRTLNDLQAVKRKLDAAAQRTQTPETPVWYVDVPANRVVVQATSEAAAQAFTEAAGVAGQDVGVHVSAQRPRVLADLVGGDAYYIDAKARCSIGFSVTKGEQQGFASAGHCGKPGAKTTGADKTDQGTFEASTFPGKDMSWVGVNAGWTATPDVKAQDGKKVQVAGSVQALVGAAVCRSGSTTGWHCGTIEQHDTSVSYAEGTVDGLTRTTVCAEPGDSAARSSPAPRRRGHLGRFRRLRQWRHDVLPAVNPVLEDFGLTLKTTSAESAAPAPQDNATTGAWSAGRVYRAGATVTHGGVRYQCLQDHQAQGSWSPEATPALWQRM